MTDSAVVYDAARLFDGERFVEPARVAVRGGRIEAVGEAATGSSAPVEDLGDVTLMPGFVDCHQHLVFDGNGTLEEQVTGRTDEELTERARANARWALAGGVTTLRDLGDRGYVTLGLRDEPGMPTIQCAGPPITVTEGHCWYLGGEVTDRASMIAAVRERVERGCDVVKIMATGGQLTPATPAWRSQFGADDLGAMVDEAHRLDRPVAAHCHGVEGISNAVDAGVDTIEHCSFDCEHDHDEPDPDVIRKVAESGIALSATFGRCGDPPFPPDQWPAWIPRMIASVAKVRELGGNIVVGTDAGIGPLKPHDVAPHAIEPLLLIGMSPVEAFAAMTSRGADALGLVHKGRLAPGADADMVAIDGDLVEDPDAIRRIAGVWKAGSAVER